MFNSFLYNSLFFIPQKRFPAYIANNGIITVSSNVVELLPHKNCQRLSFIVQGEESIQKTCLLNVSQNITDIISIELNEYYNSTDRIRLRKFVISYNRTNNTIQMINAGYQSHLTTFGWTSGLSDNDYKISRLEWINI